MKGLFFILLALAIAENCQSQPFRDFPIFRKTYMFHRRSAMERVSVDKNLTAVDLQNAKAKGPNVCPKRVFLGISFTLTYKNGKQNSTRILYYRTAFHCCPGFAQHRGRKGCPIELYTSSKNLVEVMSDLGLSTFVSLVKAAGLERMLTSKARYTIFAPNDKAFSKLPKETLEKLIRNPKNLAKFLLVSIVGGKLPAGSLKDEQLLKTMDTLHTLRVNVLFRGRVITVQGARVVKANQGAKNGIVHVVDQLATPATLSSLDILKRDKRFSKFYQMFVDAGLQLPKPLTIFAPTNSAFEKLTARDSVQCLQNFLKYHIISRTVYSSMIRDNMRLAAKTMEGSRLALADKNGSLAVNNAKVIDGDYSATDGVVQVIDEVLITNSALTLVDVTERAGATEITKLIRKAGLDIPLSSNKAFTLFAPSNEALAELPQSVKDSLKDPVTLKNVLFYHLAKGKILAGDLENEEMIHTLNQNKTIRVNVYSYGKIVTVQGASILPSKFDLKSCKGVVHVIDKVLLPPNGSIGDILEKEGRFSTLLSLLDKAGLIDALRKMKAVTLFAPTDRAFSSIGESGIKKLLEDEIKLKDLLKYHLFKGTLFSASLQDNCELFASNGEKLDVELTDKGVKVNNALVTEADVAATNGVIHVINEVLQEQPSPMEEMFSFFELF